MSDYICEHGCPECPKLRAEVERLRGIIVAFVKEHNWAHPRWWAEPTAAALKTEAGRGGGA